MSMLIKNTLIKFHWLLSGQFGLDPLRFIRSMRGLPSFIRDWRRFCQGYSGRLTLVPCLHDRFEEGGVTKSEYFWQDLLVARWIHEAKPERHVDVGSRVDGFVAHVASFREIEVFDVRPITSLVPGVIFRQADLMDATSLPSDIAGGGTATLFLACMRWSTLVWAATMIRLILAAGSVASLIWRHCSNQEGRFTSPHRLGASALSSTLTGCSIRALSSNTPKPMDCVYRDQL